MLYEIHNKNENSGSFYLQVESTTTDSAKTKDSVMEIDDQEEESPSTFKRKKSDAHAAKNVATKDVKLSDDKDPASKAKKDIKSKLETRRDSKEKVKTTPSKQMGNPSEVANGSGTLSKSRKKKAAPPPPTQQKSSTQASKNDAKDNNDVSSSSSISKSSGKRVSRKEKKHSSSSSSFAVTSSNSEECPFLAFKVKVNI